MSHFDESDQLNDLVKLSFFSGIGKAISSARTIRETLEAVMDQVGTIFAPSYWSLLLRNPKTGDLTFSIAVGSGVEQLKGMVIPKGQGIVGWIAEHGEALIIEDVSRDPRFSPDIDKLTRLQTKSIIGVPLKNNGKVFGVIELINKLDGGAFSPLELSLLSTIADFAAIAIEKAYYLKALKRIAVIDPLTGLNNRRSFISYFEKESDRSRRTGRNFSIMMVDLDGFKKINDQFGHSEGDKVLIRVADLFRKHLRTADFACRYGGDEFAVLMPETNKMEAENLKKRVLEQLERENESSPVKIGLSIGIHESSGENLTEVMHMADTLMYREKNRKIEQSVDDLAEHLAELSEAE